MKEFFSKNVLLAFLRSNNLDLLQIGLDLVRLSYEFLALDN
jgi:hypothetical protein